MSNLVASSPEAQARAWLPGKSHDLAGVTCPDCQAWDTLVYSTGDAYIACLFCGWQRRLQPGHERLVAALAASGIGPWSTLLLELAARPADPLPPVAALLWRRTGPRTWAGPSRTQPGTGYTVTQSRTGLVHCSCPTIGRGCWHRRRCCELGLVELPDTIAQVEAYKDLWG